MKQAEHKTFTVLNINKSLKRNRMFHFSQEPYLLALETALPLHSIPTLNVNICFEEGLIKPLGCHLRINW